jgi:hypothetical protein
MNQLAPVVANHTTCFHRRRGWPRSRPRSATIRFLRRTSLPTSRTEGHLGRPRRWPGTRSGEGVGVPDGMALPVRHVVQFITDLLASRRCTSHALYDGAGPRPPNLRRRVPATSFQQPVGSAGGAPPPASARECRTKCSLISVAAWSRWRERVRRSARRRRARPASDHR